MCKSHRAAMAPRHSRVGPPASCPTEARLGAAEASSNPHMGLSRGDRGTCVAFPEHCCSCSGADDEAKPWAGGHIGDAQPQNT